MITPMVKYNFLLYRADLTGFLEQLQNAGMIHVETENVSPDDETAEMLRKSSSYEKIYEELQYLKSEMKPENGLVPFDGDASELLKTYTDVKENQARLEALIKKTEQDIAEANPWGSFNREDLERIEKMNIKIRYYSVNVKQFNDEWANRYSLYEINRIKNDVYFVILQDSPDFNFELQESKPPVAPCSDLTADLQRFKEEYKMYSKKMQLLALSIDILANARKSLTEKIDFNFANLSVLNEAEGNIKLLTGWLPKEKMEKFNKFLESQNVVYFVKEKLDKEDSPPILLKNNRFAKLFEPLTNLYSLPNYWELDPTVFFAPFFMMFFGFCLGDGGYGLLILLAASVLKLKIKTPEIRPYLSLAQYLGGATLIFGFITATFFGFEFSNMKLDKIAEQSIGLPDGYGMLCLALVCGFVQIIFGMCVKVGKVVHQSGWKYALSEIGWIAIITGGVAMYATSGSPVANNISTGFFALGAILALFFNSPDKNPFMNFGLGVWAAYNMVSGLLGDLLSYLRLFALGMTGGILGNVFNTLAFDAGDGVGVPVASQIVTLIILVFGHGLNFMLGSLGAAIHPMRLTFVEFYKNAGFEGGGTQFKTFEKINNN